MFKGNGLLLPRYEVRNPGLKKKINWGAFPGMSAYWGMKNRQQVKENLQSCHLPFQLFNEQELTAH
jgi:hypothetical protein